MEKNKNFMYFSLAICALCIAILSLTYAFSKIAANKQNPSFITVDGSGFVDAKPDTAIVNVVIKSESKETDQAQNIVKEKAQNLIKSMLKLKIEEKDIKTERYSSYPKYEYPQTPICIKAPCPAPQKPILTGYEVSQNITIKLRQLEKIDELLKELGKLGITEFSTPNFVIEDMTKLKEIARKNAIEDAKNKAKKLAADLGVKIMGVSSFSEQNNYQPMYMAKAMTASMDSSSANPESITKGENRIAINVSITYEIKGAFKD